MVRAKFTARGIESITVPGYHSDPDHQGLYLQVRSGSGGITRSWLFRFTSPVTGKRREMGLGPLSARSLANARQKAAEYRTRLLDGMDPLEAVAEDREARRRARASSITFRVAAERCIKAKQAEWSNEKHKAQWFNTIKTYAYPILAEIPVDAVDTDDVLKVLEPIWMTKTETATRVRQRIETILDWSKARGYMKGENPARHAGHLSELLPKARKVKKVKHHPALPYKEVHNFVTELRERGGASPQAFEFLIQTSCRTGEVIGAKWDEIDLQAGVWTIPASRMKADKEHRVPLNVRAVEILETVAPLRRAGGFVFPSPRLSVDTHISNGAFLKIMKGMPRYAEYTPHGFRSSFRDWASDQTAYANTTVELALAHTIKDKTEAAYRREDQLEKRSRLMGDWCQFIDTAPAAGDNVVNLRSAG